MKLGVLTFFTSYGISPAGLALAAELAGFESVWAGDHSHVPVGPGGGPPLDTRTGLPVPSHYAELLDPFVALSFAAAATSTIRLGTGICLVTERDPITTAKSVASLDCLSGGRLIFGAGAGWNEIEMRDHGTDPSTRYDLLRERIEAMKAIWTHDVASYEGTLVRFGPMLCGPKPVQKPHPPIYLGGNYRNIDRVLSYADGWIPSTTVASADAFLPHVGSVRTTVIHAGSFGAADRDLYASAGVERAVLIVPPERDDCLRQLEKYAELV